MEPPSNQAQLHYSYAFLLSPPSLSLLFSSYLCTILPIWEQKTLLSLSSAASSISYPLISLCSSWVCSASNLIWVTCDEYLKEVIDTLVGQLFMSDHVVQSYNDTDGIVRQSRRHHKSAWMAHWTDTSCKRAVRGSLDYESKKDVHDTKQRSLLRGSEIEANISIFAKRPREVSTVRTAKILDERLVTSSRKLKREGYDWKHASPFLPVPEWALIKAETPSRNYNFQRPEKTMKLHNFFKKNDFVASRSSKDDFIGSTSKAVPRAPILSMSIGEEDTNPSSSLLASKEHYVNNNCHSYSTFFVHEDKVGYMMNSGRPDPSTSNDQRPIRIGKRCNVSPHCIGICSSSCQCCHQVPTKSVSDIETMRICTNVNSVQELSIHHSKNHQITHCRLVAGETDVELSAKFKGKMLSELFSLSQDIGSHGRQGVKLQLLESSTDSEEREKIKRVKTSAVGLKNESSANTNTMEMSALRENHLSGFSPSLSNKDLNGGRISPPSQVAEASTRGDTGQHLSNTDRKQMLPGFPAAASSTDDKDTSSSRTQSLDMERLFSNTEQAADSKSIAWPDGFLASDPSSRWVKRLMLSTTSDSLAQGTKSSKMEDPSSCGNTNKLFSNISSEATGSRYHGKEKIMLDRNAVFLRNGKPSTHSHSWIRRWCHNQAASTHKSNEAVVSCAPESFKETSDFKFQKKQFPSIAAMALMGKAMNGFRPCEFQKMGSSVVWKS